MKKIFSLLLCFIILLSFSLVPAQAAEINGFYSKDMTVKVTDPNNNDITSSVSVSSDTYLNKSCTVFKLPTTDVVYRSVFAYHIENLNTSHEYNIKFSASSSLTNNIFELALVFYDSYNNILKEQTLYNSTIGSSWTNVDIDFKPDASGLGGYKTRLEFRFVTSNKLLQYYRLSEIIEFTDKDDNSSWFEKIINAIKELPSNFVNGVKGFFDNLGNKFESVGNSITNKFEEVKNAIGQWFTDIGNKLSNKFQEIGNAITSKFQEIGDEFSARFDKFKPRFYEVFTWRYGWVNSDSIDYYDEDLGCAVITEGFYVPSGTSYIFNIEPSDFLSQEYFEYFQIDIFYFDDGSFKYLESTTLDLFFIYYNEGYELPSGFTYYFALTCLDWTFDSYLNGVSLSDFCNSVVRVYADEGWLTAFVQSILSGLKTLFLPTGEFFENKLEELRVFFDEKFGLFALPFTLFVRLVSLYNDIGVGSGVLHLKDFNIFGTNFLSSQDINLKELITNFSNKVYLDSGVDLYEIYFAFIDVIILFAFVRLIKNKYEKMLGTGSFSMPKDIMREKKGFGEVNDN